MRRAAQRVSIGGRPATVAPRGRVLIASLIAVALVAGCGDEPSPPPDAGPSAAVRPVVAPASTAIATAPPQLDPPPRAGSAVVAPGPFTDRLRISHLAFASRGGRPSVTARMLNLTDVSEVIVLEVRADFYDRAGRHVGAATQVFKDAEAFDHEDDALRVRLRPAAQVPEAVAAVVTVPQLVNE